MKTIIKKSIMLMVFVLAACSPVSQPNTTEEPQTLTVMTHDSFAVSAEVVAAFETQHNAEVVFLMLGDAGEATNRAVLSADAPLADVFYGVDNTFLSRALDGDIFEAYESPLLAEVPDEFELDQGFSALPVDYGDVCLNYDLVYFEENNLVPPADLEALLLPEYRSLLVVENPATSSPGLAFLFATIGHFGEDGYLEFWGGLVANDVKVVSDWNTAFYTEFSRWGGQRPIVVSYASSPPVDLIFAEEPMDAPVTAALVSDGACFRQIEFVGILKGTQHRQLAEAWVDFMLSATFQEDLPLQMFVFPVNPNAALAPEFVDFLVEPKETAFVNPADIAAHREEWIQAWTDTVLR
jgi:thiamine transport system substrate-binding protein